MIYHITSKIDWETARKTGAYRGDTLATEGFIHCSDEEQITTVANARFKGQAGLVLLCIDPIQVGPHIVRENLEGGQALFPHIYGPLNLDAVSNVVAFEPGENGLFELPNNMPR
jgi:uncharacterized protein (DUF952 family)